ncbi:transcriptional regulator GutM [Lichenibacterium dinghuense]|uniref:transcriptional regulator GutM n=1 Tax=Lichenibacterium dinghuense TaxID=2895977 RepID=UPI001F387740|nr:transcriptional regulator GutM [Lichenibacterium sp. 6Y81]
MPSMALAIAGLAVAWSLQAYGTWRQIQHYSAAMGQATRSWSDGYVGTGKARSRWGAGTVLLLVVGPDRAVRRLLVMRGVTVFARFRRLPEVEGLPLAAVADHAALRPADRAALMIAAEQVERAAGRARSEERSKAA